MESAATLLEHPTLPLNAAQRAFLAFHAEHLVTEWRWHFAGTQLRASAAGGVATLWKDDLEALVAWGLLVKGVGCADVALTEAGRDIATEPTDA